MSILVKCKCGKTLSVKPESVGKKGKCPGCGSLFTIPAPTRSASPAAKDPFDIPFASAGANHGDNAFWNELQRSTASAVSNSPSEERADQGSTNRSTNSYLQNAKLEARERESRERKKGIRTKSPELAAVAVIALLLCILVAPIALYFLYDSVTFMQSDDYVSVVEAKQKYNPTNHTTTQMSASDIALQKSLNRSSQEAAERQYAAGLISNEELMKASGANAKLAAELFQSSQNANIASKAEFYDSIQATLIGSSIVSVLSVLIAGVCFRYLLRPSE